jgi:hypothetical protein
MQLLRTESKHWLAEPAAIQNSATMSAVGNGT